MGSPWTRQAQRHERRRRLKVEVALERNDTSHRAVWLLPRSLGGELPSSSYRYDLPTFLTRQDEVEGVIERNGLRSLLRYEISWLTPFNFARICTPRLHTFPPVFEERSGQLCPLYMPVESATAIVPSSALVEPSTAGDEQSHASLHRIAGDPRDIEKWHAATMAYLQEIGDTQREVIDYWRTHGRSLPLSGFKRRAFRRWQEFVDAAYQRIVDASERYRPVFDQVNEMATATDRAYDTLTGAYRTLREWEERPIWCLLQQAERYVIARTDIGQHDEHDVSGVPIRDLCTIAWEKRHVELAPVDWDERSVMMSDDELETLFREHREIGLTRSGRPLIHGPPVLFISWLDDHISYDYWHLSDREKLAEDQAEDIERRARLEGERDRHRARSGHWRRSHQ